MGFHARKGYTITRENALPTVFENALPRYYSVPSWNLVGTSASHLRTGTEVEGTVDGVMDILGRVVLPVCSQNAII